MSKRPLPSATGTTTKADIRARITEAILTQLEQGTRPWAKPWNAEHLAGRITRSLRANGTPYRGINVVMLWLAATGEAIEREIFFMKHYTVFNVEQVDGLPPHFYAPAAPQISAYARIERAEAFFAATSADVRHGGNRAFYAIDPDYVQMPPFETFRDAESY